jgi:hypothetical protein
MVHDIDASRHGKEQDHYLIDNFANGYHVSLCWETALGQWTRILMEGARKQ